MPESFERQLQEVATEAGRTGHLASAAAVRARGDQRRRRHAVAVGALVLVLLAGASAGVVLGLDRWRGSGPVDRVATTPPTTPPTAPHGPPSASAAPSPSGSPTPSGSGAAQWANSTQFMEVSGSVVRGGQHYLTVRPARKQVLGESFETVPIPGPYTEVELLPGARIRHLDGRSGAVEAFLRALADRPADKRVEAFDLYFDGQGRVIQVDWLYNP